MWDKRSDVINSLEFYRLETIEQKTIPYQGYQYYIDKYQSTQ